MSMTVVPNPDGSYTVECNGVKVTVGGHATPIRKPPKKPDPNDGGVVAYLHVGSPSHITFRPLDSPFTEVPPPAFTRAVPEAVITLHPGLSGPTVVQLDVPPGVPLDLQRLQQALAEWRAETGREAELHIHVGWGGTDPLHIETQLERG